AGPISSAKAESLSMPGMVAAEGCRRQAAGRRGPWRKAGLLLTYQTRSDILRPGGLLSTDSTSTALLGGDHAFLFPHFVPDCGGGVGGLGRPGARRSGRQTGRPDGYGAVHPDLPGVVDELINGKSPTAAAGNFTLEASGGTPVLTDGTFGTIS